jgi:hypothetical protein
MTSPLAAVRDFFRAPRSGASNTVNLRGLRFCGKCYVMYLLTNTTLTYTIRKFRLDEVLEKQNRHHPQAAEVEVDHDWFESL